MPNADETQVAAIRAYMEAGHWISPLDALAHFKTFRLSARVLEIKRALEGSSRCVVKRTKVLTSGKRIAEYTIAAREQAHG